MKILNIFILLLATIAFVACDPLKDINEELEANEGAVTADLNIVLGSDDYELSGNDNAAKFGNFGNEDDAKEGIPKILSSKYPVLGKGSSAIVTYDTYAPIRMSQDSFHELSDADYDSLDHGFGTLSRPSDIIEAAEFIVMDPQDNEVLVLKYEWWTGSSAETRENKLTYYEGDWYVSYVPSADDYYAMGQDFTNFSSRSTARQEIENIINSTYYVSAEDGDLRTAVFIYTYKDDEDNRQFDNFLAVFSFEEGKWAAIQDVSTRVLQLGHDGSKWVPDNTIKYAMTGDDYAFIVTEYAAVNASGVGSMDSFGNYDITIWSSEEIQNSVTDVLLKNFPSAAEGQKYLVSYSVWTGSSGETHTIHLVKSGDTYEPAGG